MPLPSVGPNKRPAPITSSAFAFSLGTPKQKRPKANGKITPSSVNPPPPPSPNSQQKARNESGERDAATLQTPFRRQNEHHGTSSKETSAYKARATTPSINPNRDLTSNVRQYLSPAPLKVARRTAGGSSKLQPMSLHTPSRRSHEQESASKPKSLRRVTEQLDQLPLKKEESTEAKVALQATRLSGKVTEDLAARKRTILVDDEQETGVSPNGKKITKWSGKGLVDTFCLLFWSCVTLSDALCAVIHPHLCNWQIYCRHPRHPHISSTHPCKISSILHIGGLGEVGRDMKATWMQLHPYSTSDGLPLYA